MKVTFEDDYRRFYTIEDFDHAKKVIACERDDLETPKGWAEYAANEALQGRTESLVRIVEASARTAKNQFADNAYGNDTGNMDVWIEALAETTKGYLKFGAYLSDIFQTGSIPYFSRMFCKFFYPNE